MLNTQGRLARTGVSRQCDASSSALRDGAAGVRCAFSVCPWELRVDGRGFAATVVEHLDPVLAPRGFPSQAPGANDDAVLFHCDGPDVDDVLDRYPAWREPLRESYGSQPIHCLDLWVQRDDRARSWSFESFDGDVAAAAGPEAMQRLDELQDAALHEWAAQLAYVLDVYFSGLEAGRAQPNA